MGLAISSRNLNGNSSKSNGFCWKAVTRIGKADDLQALSKSWSPLFTAVFEWDKDHLSATLMQAMCPQHSRNVTPILVPLAFRKEVIKLFYCWKRTHPMVRLPSQPCMDACRMQSTTHTSEKQSLVTHTQFRQQNRLWSRNNVHHFKHDYIFKRKKC